MAVKINPAKKRKIRVSLWGAGFDVDTSRPEAKVTDALLKRYGFVGASRALPMLEREATKEAEALAYERDRPEKDVRARLVQEALRRGGSGALSRFRESAKAAGISPEIAVGGVSEIPVVNEVTAIVRGLPRFAVTAGRDFGRLPYDLIARPDETPELWQNVVAPIGKSYAEKYGPLLPGGRPASETWERIKDEPVATGLDVGALASLGVRGAAAGGLLKVPESRVLRTGRTEVELLQSPNPLAALAQARKDRISERLQAARDQGETWIPARLGADVRAARQTERDFRQDLLRKRAGAAQDISALENVPRKARPRVWYEAQLPETLAPGEGLARAEQYFRNLASEAKGAGDAKLAARLTIEAEKIKRSGSVPYDSVEAVAAARRLMEDRKTILQEAGKLTEESAAGSEGWLARELGLEPTGAEVYTGHRFRDTLRKRIGLPTSLAGKPRLPEGVGRERTGAAFRSGLVVTDPRQYGADWQAAQGYAYQNKVRDYLAKVGKEVDFERGPTPGKVLFDPEGHLDRPWRNIDPAVKASREGGLVDDVLRQDIEDMVRSSIAREGSPEGKALLDKAQGDGRTVYELDPETVRQLVSPGGESMGRRATGALGESPVPVWDTLTDLVRGSLIYANPGYVPANVLGNLGFAATAEGLMLPTNLARSAALMSGKAGKGLTKAERIELRNRARAEVGMGPTTSLGTAGRGPVSFAIQKLARAEGLVADDIIRLAVWQRRARKEGVKTFEQQLEFLRKAADEDPAARALANKVKGRMEEAMVNFNIAGPKERAFARKYLFVWPWMRGAIRYPYTTARDMPVRSAVLATASEEKAADKSMDTFPLPSWMEGTFKVGPGKFINPRVVSTVSTPLELGQTIANALMGKDKASLLDIANPLIRLGADVGRSRNRYGQEVGALEALKQGVGGMSPLGTTIGELVDPSLAPKIYGPQDWKEVLRRKIGRGAIPIRIDEREAWNSARKDASPEEKVRGDHLWLGRDYTTATKQAKLGEKLPDEVEVAIQWREYRALKRLEYAKKKDLPPELFQEGKKTLGALGNIFSDLRALQEAGRIDEETVRSIAALAWQLNQHPATRGRLSSLSGEISQRYYGQSALTAWDARLKMAGVEPPTRD